MTLACTVGGVVDTVGVRDPADVLRPFVPVIAVLVAVGAVLSEPGSATQNIAAVAAAGPLVVWAWFWRDMPMLLVVALTSVALVAALWNGKLEALLFLLCVAASVVGGWEPSMRVAAAAGTLAAATPVLIEYVRPDQVLWGVWIMGIALSLLFPLAFRRQISLVTQLAAAREEIARQAALEEKRAIARDVHDLVGHGLVAALLHVTGARHLLRRDPDAADEALADAEAVGRRSLQELRRTLGVLRATDGHDPADSASAPPLPGAGDLARSVETARAAGLDVALQTKGDIDDLDPVVGLSVHRVAEEALANALQHAPLAVTDVVLLVDGDTVTLTVETVGPLEAHDPGELDRARYGLVGMRERMAAVDGELSVGPTATGWLVRCSAPLTPVPSEELS